MRSKFVEILAFIAALIFITHGRALVQKSEHRFERSHKCFEAPTEKEAIAGLERHYDLPIHFDPEKKVYTLLYEESSGREKIYTARLYETTHDEGPRFKACL